MKWAHLTFRCQGDGVVRAEYGGWCGSNWTIFATFFANRRVGWFHLLLVVSPDFNLFATKKTGEGPVEHGSHVRVRKWPAGHQPARHVLVCCRRRQTA